MEYRASARSVVVTSDATAAYRLVDNDVALVQRTLVFLKPDILAVIDRVRLAKNPLPVQVRFQIDNSDGMGSVSADAGSFTVHRPLVTARTLVLSHADVTVRTGNIEVPPERGVFPYAEAESAPALDHLVLTVCEAHVAGEKASPLHAAREGDVWRITGDRKGVPVVISIDTKPTYRQSPSAECHEALRRILRRGPPAYPLGDTDQCEAAPPVFFGHDALRSGKEMAE